MKVLRLVVGLAVAAVIGANAMGQDDLVVNKEKKLAEPWLEKAAWHLDYDKAKAESAKSGKPIFGYFTRSYRP